MANRVQKLRAWLTENKIIFETVAALLLSMMALLVSFLTYRTSVRQADLMRRQAMPQFVAQRQLFLSRDGKYHDDQITVTNKGASARDAEVEWATFIELTCRKVRNQPRPIRLPISGYYINSFLSEGLELGFILTNPGNNDVFGSLEDEINTRNNPTESVDIDLISYVRATFQDLLGSRPTEYYLVQTRSVGRRVSDDEGKKAFDEAQSAEAIPFSQLTANKVTAACRNQLR